MCMDVLQHRATRSFGHAGKATFENRVVFRLLTVQHEDERGAPHLRGMGREERRPGP